MEKLHLDEILGKFNNVKKQGSGYTSQCPGHDDKENSLSVTEGTDERILLYCHAGCPTDRILDSMGLKLADLYPSKDQDRKQVAEYLYKDTLGNVVHKTIRYEPKGFTQCRPDGKGGWIYNLKDIQPIIYNLQRVTEAISKGETVYIVEGEKDVDNLGKIGLSATTSPMGAGKWQSYYSDYLINAITVIIPDNDTIGKSHSEQIAKSLNRKAKSIKVIDLTKGAELPPKGDITNFFKILGKPQGIESLKSIVNDTKEWNPQQTLNNKFQTIDASTLSNTSLDPIRYVISSTISVGLHLLAGAPKLGKSWLIIWMCLQIARGRQVWGQETMQGTTLYLCLEDNLNRIQYRMNIVLHGEAAPDNVHFAIVAKSINDGLLEQIKNWMILHPDTRLIAIDTLQKVRGQHRTDNMYANDYQDASQLKLLADKHGIAILLVHHLRKMLDNDVFNMVSGSTGLTGCVDSTFVLKKEDRQSQEATLYATGRDIEDMELLLKFNKSICTWELISTDAESFKEEKEFNENPLVIAVTKMLADKRNWNGKALDLLVELRKYSDDDLPTTPNVLTRKLNDFKNRLKNKHIKYLNNQKSSGTFITLEYTSPLSPLSPQPPEPKALQEHYNITIVSPLSPLNHNCNNNNGDSGDIVAICEKTDNLDTARVCGGNGDSDDIVKEVILGDEPINYLKGVI